MTKTFKLNWLFNFEDCPSAGFCNTIGNYFPVNPDNNKSSDRYKFIISDKPTKKAGEVKIVSHSLVGTYQTIEIKNDTIQILHDVSKFLCKEMGKDPYSENVFYVRVLPIEE